MTQDNRNKVGMKLNRIYVMFVRFSQPSLFRARSALGACRSGIGATGAAGRLD